MSASGRFSRRDFLKFSGSAVLGLLWSGLRTPAVRATGAAQLPAAPTLGRVVYNTVKAYDVPGTGGNVLKTYKFDQVLAIVEQVSGMDETAYNRVWYRLQDGGYAYSGRSNRCRTCSMTSLPKSLRKACWPS